METSSTDARSNSQSVATIVAANRERVLERIRAACERSGRDPQEVTLVAVTKYAQLDWVRALVECGATELGESRPQQLAARAGELSFGVRWHLIGHLQRNKVRLMLPTVALIHSIDSLRLLEAVDRTAGEMGLKSRVLIEVNLTGEESKQGFAREELIAAWDKVIAAKHVQVSGLMTMAAYSSDPEAARATFADLRNLRDELRGRSPAEIALPHLSMGMSGDFEVAVEEGATLVRVGSTLWEGLE